MIKMAEFIVWAPERAETVGNNSSMIDGRARKMSMKLMEEYRDYGKPKSGLFLKVPNFTVYFMWLYKMFAINKFSRKNPAPMFLYHYLAPLLVTLFILTIVSVIIWEGLIIGLFMVLFIWVFMSCFVLLWEYKNSSLKDLERDIAHLILSGQANQLNPQERTQTISELVDKHYGQYKKLFVVYIGVFTG